MLKEIYKPKHYILAYKRKRKDARRHIVGRYDTKQACIDKFNSVYDPNYIYAIFTYDWKFVTELDINIYKKEAKK